MRKWHKARVQAAIRAQRVRSAAAGRSYLSEQTIRGRSVALGSVPWSICSLPATEDKIGGFRPAQDGIAMNAGDEHTDDGLRRTESSFVVPPGKERVRAQRTSQCCHCASIQLLPGLQGRRSTPWEAVGGTNTLAPVRPMHKKCYGVMNAAPRRCSPIELRRRTGAMTA